MKVLIKRYLKKNIILDNIPGNIYITTNQKQVIYWGYYKIYDIVLNHDLSNLRIAHICWKYNYDEVVRNLENGFNKYPSIKYKDIRKYEGHLYKIIKVIPYLNMKDYKINMEIDKDMYKYILNDSIFNQRFFIFDNYYLNKELIPCIYKYDFNFRVKSIYVLQSDNHITILKRKDRE